jgi:ubiquinone/menaquinone biosynthesis C-methylase UbiE/uncharacterized protein YbaR (Trm112 family)
MQAKHLPFLRCAITNSTLTLCAKTYFPALPEEIESGYLISEQGYLYPIINGVPRMLPNSFLVHKDALKKMLDNYDAVAANIMQHYKTLVDNFSKANSATQESFSVEWGMFDYNTDKVWDADQQGMLHRFYTEINSSAQECKNKILLDAGCGNGLLDKLLAQDFEAVVAVDFSESVINAYKKSYASNIFFVQGDVQNLPVQLQAFDVVQCSGVLVTIKEPRKCFDQLISFLKPKGKLSVWLYHPRKNFIHNVFNAIRNVTSRLPLSVQAILYRVVIFPPSYLVKKLKGNKQNAREQLIDIYDWFSPQYRWEFTHEEAKQWYASQFDDVLVTTNELFGFNIVGTKK